MKNTAVALSVVAVVAAATPTASAMSYASKAYVVRGGDDFHVRPPEISAPAYFTLCTIESIDFKLDDDGGFDCEPVSGGYYRLRANRMDSDSYVKLRVWTIELPPGGFVKRKTIALVGSQDEQSSVISVPPGYAGVALVEILRLDTGGDDDIFDVARAFALDRNIVTVAVSGRGNSDSEVRVRTTVVCIPEAIPMITSIDRLSIRMGHPDSSTWSTPGPSPAVLTSYMSDPAGYEKWNSLASRILLSQFTGATFNQFGTVSAMLDPGDLVDPANVQTVLTAIKFARRIYDEVSGWFADEFDDDFSVLTSRLAIPGGKMFYARMTDGNTISQAEVTVFHLYW